MFEQLVSVSTTEIHIHYHAETRLSKKIIWFQQVGISTASEGMTELNGSEERTYERTSGEKSIESN